MYDLLSQIRYACRQFRNAPVFTIAAVLTLALGIGGTTAIFSLIHSVMLKSLPVTDPARLYRVGSGDNCCVEGGPQDEWDMVSYDLYQRLKENMPEFEEVTAFQAGLTQTSVRREEEKIAKPLRAEFAAGTYFSTFGIRPFLGRLFSPSDDQPSAAPVAVLSFHAWQVAYGSDPRIVGSTIVVDSHPLTISGIAPPGFFGDTLRSDPPDLWIPLQQEPMLRGATALLHQAPEAWLRIVGRLKPGASIAGMAPRLTEVLRRWMVTDSQYPPNWLKDTQQMLPKQSIRVVPGGAGIDIMKQDYGRSLEILLAVCGLVLLIACANVANLLLARAAARRGQTAVRLAIGASRKQIIRQGLMESVLLAVFGGIAGLAVAIGASRLLLALAFHNAHYLPIDTTPSWPVLGFAFALSLMTGVVFGTAPAWAATHTHPIEALRGAGRGTRDRSTPARKVLLITQAVLSVVLVAGATMLARSLGNLENQDFGFEAQGRVMVNINAPSPEYPRDKLLAMYRDLQERLERIPGVEKAGMALYNPLTDNWGEMIYVEGHPAPKFGEQSGSSWDHISANYFQTTGQKMLRGRQFTDADNENSEKVAIVNEAFVKRFFPKEDPMDRHFGIDLPENAGTFRIIGVVRDTKYNGYDARRVTRPMFFVPLAQFVDYPNGMLQKLEINSHLIHGIMLVTRKSPGELEPAVTKVLADEDPNLTVIGIRTMEQQVALIFDQERSVASLAGLFAGMALLLAAIGLYGVMAYMVAQSTNEIGVRMALGANRMQVIGYVLGGAFRRVAIGLLIGIPLAIGAGKLLASQLWGVKAWDPLALSIAAGALGFCAFVAAMIPALRAAAISPMTALRTE